MFYPTSVGLFLFFLKKVSGKFARNKNVPYICSVQLKFFDIMKFSEFYRLLEQHGWTIKKGKRHHKYVHPDFDNFIPVGRHPSKEVPKGTLEKMLKEAGLKK